MKQNYRGECDLLDFSKGKEPASSYSFRATRYLDIFAKHGACLKNYFVNTYE
jgi:hypothetical protein